MALSDVRFRRISGPVADIAECLLMTTHLGPTLLARADEVIE
jgi:hypothetical protein